MKQILEIKKLPMQMEATQMFQLGKTRLLLLCGIKASKTEFGKQSLFEHSYYWKVRDPMMLITAPTYDLTNVAEHRFVEYAESNNLLLDYNYLKRYYVLKPAKPGWNPPYVYIRTASHPKTLKGQSWTFIWIDEGADIKEESYDILNERTLDRGGIILVTTTPEGQNWLWRKFIKKCDPKDDSYDPKYAMIIKRTEDNPILSKELIAELRADMTEELAAQELDAMIVIFSGLVFKNFTKANICEPFEIPPAKIQFCVAGMDFGYNDPTAYLWLVYYNDIFYIVDEHYLRAETYDIHTGMIQNSVKHKHEQYITRRWRDRTATQGGKEIEKLGLPNRPAIKNKTISKKEELRWSCQILNKFMKDRNKEGKLRFQVFNTCKNLIKELESREYKADGLPQRGHAVDAVRYAIISEISKRGSDYFDITKSKKNEKIIQLANEIIQEFPQDNICRIIDTDDEDDKKPTTYLESVYDKIKKATADRR